MELHNIEWYNDKELAIFFSAEPQVRMRYPRAGMTTAEKNSICKYPFENLKTIKVCLFDHKKRKSYKFTIPSGYCYDGATIPRLFWRLIGPKTDPKFLIPALIHDVLCENHHYVDNDRYFSTCVFERLLYVSGVNAYNRWMMKHSVDNFQKFCGWGKGK